MLSRRHQLSLLDPLIVQTAVKTGCTKVLAKDLQGAHQEMGETIRFETRRLIAEYCERLTRYAPTR